MNACKGWEENKEKARKKIVSCRFKKKKYYEEELNLGMKIDSTNEKKQVTKLEKFKLRRDEVAVKETLRKLQNTCEGTENIMPPLIEALKIGATVGEVNGVMREVFGTWVSPSGV